MRNLIVIAVLIAAAFMAGWFTINRDGENTTIKFNRDEIRNDTRTAINRGREFLDKQDERQFVEGQPGQYNPQPQYSDAQQYSGQQQYQDPRYQDPGYQDPRYQDPRYQDPRYQDPRYQGVQYREPRDQGQAYWGQEQAAAQPGGQFQYPASEAQFQPSSYRSNSQNFPVQQQPYVDPQQQQYQR